MKKMSWLWLLVLSCISFYACKKDDKPLPSLKADKTTIDVSKDGKSETITITSNEEWTLSVPAEAAWVTVNKASGEAGTTEVVLQVAASQAAARTANLLLSSAVTGTQAVTIKVSQSASDLTITSHTLHAKEGGEIQVTGTGFSTVPAENEVKINDKPATVTGATATSLKVTMPSETGDGKLSVKAGTKTTTSVGNIVYEYQWTVSSIAGAGSLTAENPKGILLGSSGRVYYSDYYGNRIKTGIPKSDGTLLTDVFAGQVNGTGAHVDDQGINAAFYGPGLMAYDKEGNMLVLDVVNGVIRKVTPAGTVTTIRDENNVPVPIETGCGIAVDNLNNIYVSEKYTLRIKKIDPTGNMTAFAQGGGTGAALGSPAGLAIDADGSLIVADQGRNRILKIVPVPGTNPTITTIAGSVDGDAGDIDGSGSSARFNGPTDVKIDKDGNLYVTEWTNHKLRKVTRNSDGSCIVTTIAGNGQEGFQDGSNSVARFKVPMSLAISADGGTVYVTDENYRVRKLVRSNH